MTKIAQSKVLIISANGFEQSELEVPRDTLREMGAEVHVATPDGKPVTGWDKTDWGRDAEADLKIEDADPNQYDALVIPGGQINPDLLRVEAAALAVVQGFAHQRKTIGAICHAPWVLIEAGLCPSREMTSYHSIKTDVQNAGGRWMDAEVVADNGIVTSRNPGDLDAFVGKIVEEVESATGSRNAA